MIQHATHKQSCSWTVEGIADTGEGDFGGGDITLRRVWVTWDDWRKVERAKGFEPSTFTLAT
jgi:hypothetical protein